jgi:hypothetical protein
MQPRVSWEIPKQRDPDFCTICQAGSRNARLSGRKRAEVSFLNWPDNLAIVLLGDLLLIAGTGLRI